MTTSVTNIVIFASVLVQALLLAYALLRGDRLKTGRFWLPSTLILVGIATASRLFLPDAALIGTIRGGFVFAILLGIALITFGGMVTTDLIQRRGWWFSAIGGAWLLLIIALALWAGEAVQIGEPTGWIVAAFARGALPELTLILGLGFATIGLMVLAFYTFYITPLPEVSNRALFWAFNATLIVMGFTLAMSGPTALVVLGISVLTVGMMVVTYSQISYRVFDIRNVLGFTFRLLILITFSALAIFGALALIDRLQIADTTERLVLAATLSIAVAIIYTPVRELTNWLINRLLIGANVDAVDATRRYSHELSHATQINDLVDLASRTLNDVLQVRRSGMLLVSDTSDDSIELMVMRGGGLANAEQTRVRIGAASSIYKQIVNEQEPLTQFDIEFDPDYRSATDSERAFFRSLEMSAYAPIIMDRALIGLLAAGSKRNDAPIYHRDLQLLVSMANQTGVALRNTRLVADLKHLNSSMQALNRNLGDANDRMGKLDSVKTDFVTIASHELRTPLAQVRGYTDIIDALNDQGMLNPDQTRGLVANLRKATERMEELIAAMLDVSQLDVNAMDLRFAQTSPESVLRMAIEPLTDPIRQRKLTLSARGLKGLPPIEADMQRLVQAFRNIITNAIKFTPDGGRIDIRASYHPAEQPGHSDYVLIVIADTGIGIDPQHCALVFNKFYRVADPSLHSTGTYKFMGAGPGLGLTIAKGVIDGHGGRIWVESPGHDMQQTPGSTFYIQLPLVPPETARRVLPFAERERETRTKSPFKDMVRT